MRVGPSLLQVCYHRRPLEGSDLFCRRLNIDYGRQLMQESANKQSDGSRNKVSATGLRQNADKKSGWDMYANEKCQLRGLCNWVPWGGCTGGGRVPWWKFADPHALAPPGAPTMEYIRMHRDATVLIEQ